MSANITVYQKPTCTTCRKLFALLKKKNVNFEAVNYIFDPLSREKIEDLLFKLNMSARDVMRTKESIYQELGIGKNNFSEDYLIDLLSNHPELLQRPIVERGAKAILARPIEKVMGIL
jgi:arsenate reductase